MPKNSAKTFSGKTATYKSLIWYLKAVLKEKEEATEKQKKTILELIGPVAGYISAPACYDSSSDESDSDSNCDSDSDSESDSESGSESEDSESDSDSCDGDNCKRSYKEGPRAKGRRLYKKNGGTESKWREKSDKFKDSYYEKYKGKNVEVPA